MFYLLLSTCIAISVALLAMYCCIQARIHTTPENRPGSGGAGTTGTPAPGAQTATYNSSASAVAAIWLFVQIYIVNTVRARNPQFTIPGIVACIFANVSMVYAPQFSTMAQAISFAKRLLEAFFTGFAIGTGVSLFIFPFTMREVVFKEMTGYIMTLRKAMGANMAYITSLQEGNMFSRTPTGQTDKPRTPEASAIKGIITGLAALHGKLSVDITLAKREIAIGKLGPDDMQEMFRRLRTLLLPIIGLSSVVDVFERITEEYGWDSVSDAKSSDDVENHEDKRHAESVHDWNQLSAMLHEPFSQIVGHIDDGFAHVLFTLDLVKMPKKDSSKTDEEAKGDEEPRPGEPGFTESMARIVADFQRRKADLLLHYVQLRGIKMDPDFFKTPRSAEFEAPEWYYLKPGESEKRLRYRRQLYLVLYMDFLLTKIAQGVHDFCKWADERKASGKLSRSRLVVPGYKRMRKWVISSLSSQEDSYTDESHGMNDEGNRSSNVYLGDAYHQRKDPEHLPPANTLQKVGNYVRGFPHFFRSPASSFGLRVATATMCLAIIAYLRDTHVFYITQRLFWAQIMVTISMSPSAGQSLFSFLLRIAGTFAAMCTSFIIWYIVDGHTAGVLVFFWFFVMWGFYIVIKYPKIIPVGMIFSVTNTLIIGYELQVRKIGITLSESNGQAYYPIYELAPYRLATVCAGIFVAWFWTIFPYPISEHSELRQDLGSALYLLANYYSVVQETVRTRIYGREDLSDGSPYEALEKARLKVFSKSVLILQNLRTHSAFIKYDLPIGGRFPKATYDKIINRIQDILNFTSLISFASQTFTDMNLASDGSNSESEWLRDFRRLVRDANVTSREVTTLLALLSASVASGQPLPPYLKTPEAYQLSTKLDAMDKDILSVRHIVEPGFAAFACIQIGTKCIADDLKALLRDVKELVGELDFSFHVVSTADGSAGSSKEDVARANGNDNGKGKSD